ncbi:MAG: RIP metalloprotease RseP [Clostridiales bacterium]|nr:RIP metalloprotease RseP [Clostridiales bacterium]
MSIAISIIAVVIVLGILSTAHELGHFFVARALKVKAYEVAIFMGPALFKWKKNDIDYSIRCLPIGAYVRFTEIDNEGMPVESDDPTLLVNQPRWKRLIIAIAGPLVNLFLGILIFAIFFVCAGYTSREIKEAPEDTQLYAQEYEPGDEVVAVNGRRVYTFFELNVSFYFINEDEVCTLTFKSQKTGKEYDITLTPELKTYPVMHVSDVTIDDHGWYIGNVGEEQNDDNPILKAGDYILTIDGYEAADYDTVLPYLQSKEVGDVISITYERDGETHEGEIKLGGSESYNYRGLSFVEHKVRSGKEFLGALGNAFKMPITILRLTQLVIKNAISGDIKIYQVVSGPVGVVNVVDTVVSNQHVDVWGKLVDLVTLSGMISIALTISNLLPLPGLDGSQIIILFVEMVIGRKLPKKAEDIITVVGFFVLIILVLLAFASDIAKIVIEGW